MKNLLILLLGIACLAAQDYLLVTNKEEASVSMIDLSSEKEVKRFSVGYGPHEIAVSANNKLAAVSNYGTQYANSTLSIIDIDAKRLLKTIELKHNRPHGIRFLKDNKHVLLTSESSQKLLKVNIESGVVVESYNTGGDSHMLVLNADETVAYATAIRYGFVSIHDLKTKAYTKIQLDRNVEAIDLDESRDRLWIGNNSEQHVQVIDLSTKKVVKTIRAGLMPIRLRLSRDGKYAYVSTFQSGKLLVIDAENFTIIKRIKLFKFTLEESDWLGKSQADIRAYLPTIIKDGARPIDILCSPDDRYIFVSIRGQEHVAKIDRNSWKIVARLKAGKGPDGLAYVAARK